MKKKKLYNFIIDISSYFIKDYSFDDSINKSLKKLAKITHSQRAYIFIFNDEKTLMSNSHEYCVKGVKPQKKNFQNASTKDISWWINELESKGIINIADVNDLNDDAINEKKSLIEQDIKSLLCFAIYLKNDVLGFIGVDNVKGCHFWDEDEVKVLKVSSEIISSAFEKRNEELKLSYTNSTLKASMEATKDGIIVINKDETIQSYNNNFIKMWNIPNSIIEKRRNDILLDFVKHQLQDPIKFKEYILSMIKNPSKKEKIIVEKKDGGIFEIYSNAQYIDNMHIGRVWSCRDITKDRKYEFRLKLISKVFENSNDAILITDKKLAIIDVNNSFEEISGYKKSEVLGRNPSLLQSKWHNEKFYKELWLKLDKDNHWSGEIWDRRKNGDVYLNKTYIFRVENFDEVYYIGISQDITRKKEYEQRIKQLAFYDPLTELPNRVYFKEHLSNNINEAQRNKSKFALLFIDLDNFKFVNDTFGHLIGDKLLKEVASILKSSVRKSDIVSRLSGDEFTIILRDIKKPLNVINICKKIIQKISKKQIIEEYELNIGSSIGICIYPDDTKDLDTLLQNADIAMYNSKKNGKNRYSFFDSKMNEEVMKRYEIETHMKNAVLEDQFFIEYQPLVAKQDERFSAVEALIRWEHPKLGFVYPNDFIGVAEENGMIIKIGHWIFENICQDAKRLQKLNIEKIAINISPKQLLDLAFCEYIKDKLEEFNLRGELFEFEITENVLLENHDIIKKNLNFLKGLGITLSLDDFGTGYSSIGYIKDFPIDSIKIDKSFIQNMFDNENDLAIVDTIMFLSKQLNKQVIAEGVETTAQLEHLKEYNCSLMQGYLFSKSLKLDDLEKTLLNYK